MRISIPTANLFLHETEPDVCSFLIWVIIVTPARQRLAFRCVVVTPLMKSHFMIVSAAVMARLSTSVLMWRGVWGVGGFTREFTGVLSEWYGCCVMHLKYHVSDVGDCLLYRWLVWRTLGLGVETVLLCFGCSPSSYDTVCKVLT